MALTVNRLTKQVDLPTFEWTRPLPTAATAGLSATCFPDNALFQETSGRYIYALLNATNFWRYDTVTDTYLQLSSPGITALTATSARFAGGQGYVGRVVSSGSNTILTGVPFGKQAIGYRIRIISGTGAGQERLITDVSDPIIADFGAVSTASNLAIIDGAKNWGVGAAGTNTLLNGWVGYVVRTITGTGANQVRKILNNSATVLSIADLNMYAYDPWCAPLAGGLAPTAGQVGMVATAAGTLYQIEASTITVDTAWTTAPDSTSRYVIQSGIIWLSSGATVANAGATLQCYSVLEDLWYAKSVQNNVIPIVPTENTLERITENSTIWYTGRATSGNTTALIDNTANWTANTFAGYKTFIWTGTGRAQLANIANNTANTLTFSSALSTGLDSTSRYNIVGYDGGVATSATSRTLTETGKTWAVDRWKNYAVRIVAGTGDGQTRQILGNGADSLLFYEPWTVQPDNTSVYLITGFSNDLYLNSGGSGQVYIYHAEECDMITSSRILDEGVVQIACAIPTDGTSTASHRIFDQRPVPVANISGTTTITANTVQPHNFRVGQWVSIRGVTSANADQFNVTGKVQIATIPANNQFTYTPFGTGTGTYQYSENQAVTTSALPDASKFHADVATGGSTTTVTFSRATPSNINGWYAYGTNIGAGARVESGAGGTTLTLNVTGAGTPAGVIRFTKWPLPVTIATGGGGGAGVFTATIGSALPAYCKGWLVTGTGIATGAIVTGGEGTTTISLSLACTGAVSGSLTFANPANQPLPVTATYSSNANSTSITFTGSIPSYLTDWFVSGTNMANGSRVVSGAGTATIITSLPHTGTPSGTYTFYPPPIAPALIYATTAAPVNTATSLLATGTASQLAAGNTLNGSIMGTLTALSAAANGLSRYVVTRREAIGSQLDQQNMYVHGVGTATGATGAMIDGNNFWSTATGSGSAGSTTLTLSAIGSYIHNGWYVTGTGIATGARVVSGGGTTSIVLDTPHTGSVSGTITFTAFTSQNIIGRRIRIVAGTGLGQESGVTVVTPSNGNISFTAVTTAPVLGSVYQILPGITPGAGSTIQWQSDSSSANNRGRFLFRVRGGAVAGIDKIDITTDRYIPMYTVPFNETLGSGSQYAYDGYDRLYFTKDITNRLYYLDMVTNTVHGAGLIPYVAGTAGLGNTMEIFKTVDGLKYLWVNRKGNVEVFRQLIFY